MKLKILILLNILLFSCTNLSRLSIVSTNNYDPKINYESIGIIEAESITPFFWLYSLIIPGYKKTSIEFVIKMALKNYDADYITDVKVIESMGMFLIFGSKSVTVYGEGWKKINIDHNFGINQNNNNFKKPYFNPETGELITD